jgi:hypothetical protein
MGVHIVKGLLHLMMISGYSGFPSRIETFCKIMAPAAVDAVGRQGGRPIIFLLPHHPKGITIPTTESPNGIGHLTEFVVHISLVHELHTGFGFFRVSLHEQPPLASGNLERQKEHGHGKENFQAVQI